MGEIHLSMLALGVMAANSTISISDTGTVAATY
jgi:hypothetical protein